MTGRNDTGPVGPVSFLSAIETTKHGRGKAVGYSASYIIPRFAKYAGKSRYGSEPDGTNGHDRQRFPDGSGSSLYYETDRQNRVVGIMSYGSHFPLAHLVLDKAGRRKRWILNGDWWPGSGYSRTNDHNTIMRELAQKSGTPWIIVPFSAMREAGIDLASIIPVDMAAERRWQEEHTSANLSDVPQDERKQRAYYDASGNVVIAPRASDGSEAHPDYDDDVPGWFVSRYSPLEGHHRIPVPGPEYEALTQEYEKIHRQPDGLYHWWTHEHQLGESLFRATYSARVNRKWVTRRALFLSAFDENEAPPVYFLAELPRNANPATIAEAREALKPGEVFWAEENEIPYQRQGDIFAIRSAAETRDLPGPTKHSEYILDTNHVAREVRMLGEVTYARGRLVHRPRDGRRPDHATIVLGDGKTWHMLVRNTVPHSYGLPRAWTQGGRVD